VKCVLRLQRVLWVNFLRISPELLLFLISIILFAIILPFSSYEYMTTLPTDKCFGLADVGQRALEEHTAVCRKWEALSIAISTIHGIFFQYKKLCLARQARATKDGDPFLITDSWHVMFIFLVSVAQSTRRQFRVTEYCDVYGGTRH
jgi:hypothetical protein